jgi:hypothetical protein
MTTIAAGFGALLLQLDPSMAQVSAILFNFLVIPGMIFLYFGICAFLGMNVKKSMVIPFFIIYIIVSYSRRYFHTFVENMYSLSPI